MLAGLLALAGCGDQADVETIRPWRGTIVASFRGPARTRLASTHLITMPVAGRIGRIDLVPGDPVKKGQRLTVLDLVPIQQNVAEARAAWEQTRSRLEELKAGPRPEEIVAVQAAVERATAQAEYQRRELERQTDLHRRKVTTDSELQATRLAHQVAAAGLKEARARHELIRAGPRLEQIVQAEQAAARARARLIRAEHELGVARIVSPIDGTVLEKYEQGERSLPAGHSLLLLGDLHELEVEVDVLTSNALRLRVGGAVELELAAQREIIAGEVKRIEPAGFTKLSSLGVEQQQVKVIVALKRATAGQEAQSAGEQKNTNTVQEPASRRLGVGFRLQARFITATKTDVLLVPRFSVLQAPDGTFYVFKVAAGVLIKQPVVLGLKSDLEMEITSGLAESDSIVAAPDTTLHDGDKVRASPRQE